MSDSLVIIPTYNEIENIEDIIRAVFDLEFSFHILIIDDGSPDGTAEAVKKLRAKFEERLFIEERTEKKGLGTAYIHGFKWALKANYLYVFEMDADFSHNPKDLVRLRKSCKSGEGDMIVGSRYIKGVNVVNWPLKRVLMSYGASVYVKLITGLKVHDPTSGFVCYSRKVLSTLNLNKIRFIGYAFQIEMKFKTHHLGFSIKEIPIVFTDRSKGTSKMSYSIFGEAVVGVLLMKLRSSFFGKKNT